MKLLAFCAVLSIAAVAACVSVSDGTASAALKELAPTGKLRVGVVVAPAQSAFFVVKDANGQPRGVTVDLGTALAQKLGVPVEHVMYPNSGELTTAGSLGAWDVAFMPVDAERAKVIDFGPAYYLFESTYLVPAGSPIRNIAEVDRAGVRVAAIENTTTARTAAQQLKNASLRTHRTVDELYELVRTGNTDAVALGRVPLQTMATRLPGARILDGSFHSSAVAIAVPKNRPAALRYASDFIEAAKASGSVRRAFDNAGLKDASVAPESPRQ